MPAPRGARALDRLAFGLYLAAVGALPLKWLSPLGALSPRAGWTDVFAAAAVAAWLAHRVRTRTWGIAPQLRVPFLALAAFLALSALSAALAAADRADAALNVLVMSELAMLAVLTADFAAGRRRRAAIVLAVLAGAAATCALAALGVGLFYAGVRTSLIGAYGEQFVASDDYARVAAGFHSPPLLGSYCIFAAAVLAIDVPVARRARRAVRAALGAVALATLSRAALGFFAAAAIRWAARVRSRRAVALAVCVVTASVAVIAALTVGGLRVDPTRPSSATYVVPDPGNRRAGIASSLDTLAAHPLLGSGPGSLPGVARGEPFRAHLTPLNVAATLGLPALAALCVFVAGLWRHRPQPTDVAIWSGLAGLALDALAQDVEHFRHVWILLGLAAARREPADRRA